MNRAVLGRAFSVCHCPRGGREWSRAERSSQTGLLRAISIPARLFQWAQAPNIDLAPVTLMKHASAFSFFFLSLPPCHLSLSLSLSPVKIYLCNLLLPQREGGRTLPSGSNPAVIFACHCFSDKSRAVCVCVCERVHVCFPPAGQVQGRWSNMFPFGC